MLAAADASTATIETTAFIFALPRAVAMFVHPPGCPKAAGLQNTRPCGSEAPGPIHLAQKQSSRLRAEKPTSGKRPITDNQASRAVLAEHRNDVDDDKYRHEQDGETAPAKRFVTRAGWVAPTRRAIVLVLVDHRVTIAASSTGTTAANHHNATLRRRNPPPRSTFLLSRRGTTRFYPAYPLTVAAVSHLPMFGNFRMEER